MSPVARYLKFIVGENLLSKFQCNVTAVNEACPSVSMPSAQRLKPVSNPDLWEYNPEELVRFAPLRRFSSTIVVQTHPLSGLISRSIHQRSRPTQIKRGVITATGRSPGNTRLCLDTLNGIIRMNNNVHVCSHILSMVQQSSQHAQLRNTKRSRELDFKIYCAVNVSELDTKVYSSICFSRARIGNKTSTKGQ